MWVPQWPISSEKLAAATGVALSQGIQNAAALNNLSANVAQALNVQASINGQIKGGLMVVNQRIDLVQVQVDTLWQIAQLGCEWKVSGLCVTSVYYNNYSQAANLSKELSSYLTGNWSRSFDSLMKELRVSITMVNSPPVDASLAEGFSSWILQAMSHLKEWAGVGVLTLALLGACALGAFYLCHMAQAQARECALVVRAFQAPEAGVSPQAWLAAIDKR